MKPNYKETSMKTQRRLPIALLLLSSLATLPAGAEMRENIDAKAAFGRLSALAGEWEADTKMGKAHITYELIAGGTAIVERETMDHMPPMLTVYHLDRDRLILTHYCMAGNQPRMQATSFDAARGELRFDFLDATNLASPSAGHMRNARVRLVDDKHLQSEWDFYENGRKTTETFNYNRIR
jgi:hypothetical protein